MPETDSLTIHALPSGLADPSEFASGEWERAVNAYLGQTYQPHREPARNPLERLHRCEQ